MTYFFCQKLLVIRTGKSFQFLDEHIRFYIRIKFVVMFFFLSYLKQFTESLNDNNENSSFLFCCCYEEYNRKEEKSD